MDGERFRVQYKMGRTLVSDLVLGFYVFEVKVEN